MSGLHICALIELSELIIYSTDNVVVARQQKVDRDTPGGPGYTEQKPDQKAQKIQEPLAAGNPKDTNRS